MSIFCPFCLTEHAKNECKQGKEISQTYIEAIQKGVPIYPIAFIGYTGCGKTTYLSSLIYTLFERLSEKWEWISILALNQQTIDKIQNEYISPLSGGKFPPPTARFFEDPLILKLTIPEKKFNIIQHKREVILVIYDTKGGTYDTVDTIKDNFPLIRLIPNLILLVDLYTLCEEATTTKISVGMKLSTIINKLTLALDELGSNKKRKNLIICFTKTDKLKKLAGADEDFGPLLTDRSSKPKFDDLKSYCKEEICKVSKDIQKVVKKKYNNFFKMIDDHYGGYCFVASTNIGNKAKVDEEANTFRGEYDPLGVADPILWLLTIK